MNYQTVMKVNGERIKTLLDILPENGKLKILFIAKTPAPVSVEAGHYFQGKQGKMFWNKLIQYDILSVKQGSYEDENLLKHGFGITDIVKVPRSYGQEPSKEEYIEGFSKIDEIISKYQAEIIVFVYKKVLDHVVNIKSGFNLKSVYGFNSHLEKLFNSKVFVFPMPGTPCKKDEADQAMNSLRDELYNGKYD